ncbi:MAG: Stp1/IreP family PP2C-type Ser/Thr phosphatase [Actinomycetota bacterium]
MELRIASATDRGRVREKNEDAVLTDVPLIAVADGMGGHRAGEVASSMAVDVLKTWKDKLGGSTGTKAAEILREAFAEANRAIWEAGQQDENLLGMGTTVTAGWIEGDALALAHVGDTRAYLLRGGKLEQLTRDQNVAQDLVRRGRLSEDEAAASPQRHVILQAVGVEPDGLDVEVASVELRPGDRLMLASDGLFGMLQSPDRIRTILIEHRDPDEACRILVDEANEAGGHDNISVVLVDADGAARGPAAVVNDAEPEVRIERPSEEGPKKSRFAKARLPVIVGLLVVAVVSGGLYLVSRLGNDGLLVAERGGTVVVVRGQPGHAGEGAEGDVVHVFTDERVERFPRTVREDLRSGIPVETMSEARRVVSNLPRLLGPQDTPTPSPSPSATASPPPASGSVLPLPGPGA